MSEDKDFDLKAFQEKVLEDFKAIKATMGIAFFPTKGRQILENDNELDLSFSLNGLFTRGLIGFFSFLGKRVQETTLKEPDFVEKKHRAAKIVNNPKVKKLLCRSIQREISADMEAKKVETKLVQIITMVLTEKKISNEFSIEKNARLYSFMVMNIYKRGALNYCRK